MAAEGVNGSIGPSLDNTRLVLLSNSTKKRTAELQNLNEHLNQDALSQEQWPALSQAVFDTLPRYIDMKSRHAAEETIIRILQHGGVGKHADKFVELVVEETNKKSLAPGSAFVLIRWLHLVLQECGKQDTAWSKWGTKVVQAQVRAFNTLLSSQPRESTATTSVRVTRRAFRHLLSNQESSQSRLADCVNCLTAKAASPSPQNGVILGLLAGVCGRLSKVWPQFEAHKPSCNEYFLREIVGSRAVLPDYQASSMSQYFNSFVSLQDLEKDLFPAVEKALLRAPEVVLVNILPSMVSAVAQDVDLAPLLAKNLTAPLLKNIASTNQVVRAGALQSFQALAKHSHDPASIDKVVDLILNPLRTGKVTSADHRTLYAQLLVSLPSTETTSKKVVSGLAPVIAKEANEAAAAAEINALMTNLQYIFTQGLPLESSVIDVITKGLTDKKTQTKRLWTLQLAQTLWSLGSKDAGSDSTLKLVDAVVSKLIDIWNEAQNNPLPSVQSGIAAAACATTALLCSKFSSSTPNLKNAPNLKKASVLEKSLTVEPKPSFILNPKVYTKFTTAQDYTWFLRGITALASTRQLSTVDEATKQAWAQALIFIVVANTIPHEVQAEAGNSVQLLYLEDPESITEILIQGVIQWVLDIEQENKDSTAIASKAGTHGLNRILRCLTPTRGSQSSEASDEVKDKHALSTLIISRSEFVPRANWIEGCLQVGVDPGQFAGRNADACIAKIQEWTQDPRFSRITRFQNAAYAAAADLAFVSPDVMLPRIVDAVCSDLDPKLLHDLGATEAAIYRTPEGTAFIDVLTAQVPSQPPSKNNKDYDTLKWEAELREQLAKKKGSVKKLTKDEQAKVNAQLSKESDIRKLVSSVVDKLQRGSGIIRALVNGPPTDVDAWFGKCVQQLFDAIVAGAGSFVGESIAETYMQCSAKTSSRLGVTRPFIGAVALRAAGVVAIPENVQQEPLGDAVTRILYRLRFMGEQRPFDPVTLAYALHLVFIVLEQGAVDKTGEDADEQLILAGEFLSSHTDVCSDSRLPRVRILFTIIKALQAYTQHFRLFKDCLNDFSRGIATNLTDSEADVIVKATIVPESAVRTSALQAISAELELKPNTFSTEIWIASHDDVEENLDLAHEIWEENELQTHAEDIKLVLPHSESKDVQLRRSTARSVAALVSHYPDGLSALLQELEGSYIEKAKPRTPQRDKYGMPIKTELDDPWPARHGIALIFKELAPSFRAEHLQPFFQFMADKGPLGDSQGLVRDAMVEAATAVVSQRGNLKVEELMSLFEKSLDGPDSGSQAKDLVNEAIVILYGALARHLKTGDKRVPKVVQRLMQTLSTPSESVQYAVAQCLPPLVQASGQEASKYVEKVMDDLLNGKKYAVRRGAAYGLAGIIKGRGISGLREFRVMSGLNAAIENKKDPNQRQGAFLAYELLSLILGRTFEPYIIQIVPQLLIGFADASADVREACLDAAKTCFSTLSSFGVKKVLPVLLEGLDESQWRSKKGACDSLGAMAYLDAQQLAISLPEIIPPLTEVLTDSHKEVRASANRSLQRFGEVISNPEIKSQVNILLKALSDPTKYTDEALDALIKVNFIHYLDAPSLALVVRILERGLSDRSSTKRKASQIIGSLAHLTERKDLVSHLPILVAGLRIAVVDPVPATRATASKALGSTMEKLGEDALPDLIPSLMTALKSDTGAGDRLGSAQALSEVLAGLGTGRLEETLPTILQNVSSSRPAIREGFMSLFIFLPATFGNSFANYLSKIIPPILSGLADEVESIRETSLRAGRLLVKNFATRAIDLLLPELERGLADDSYRIRLSSVELVGDLLFNLTGISGKTEQEETEEDANEAGQSLLEVLGEEKRNKVLSALYICRCDTSGLVRAAAINVWKALVSTPRTLRELIPTLTQLLIRRLASSNMEQKVIAGNALGELIRKAGENVLATLLPTLEEGLRTSTDTDARQGICIALRELISAAAPETLEDYEKTLISVVRTALVDPNPDVREAAAEAFDSLQKILGKRAVDQVLPHLLNLLRSEEDADNALSALLTLLTEQTRANIILPNLLPTLLTSPISAFNARALASLAQVASSSMTRRLPNIINSLMDTIVGCKDEELEQELHSALDTVLLSVDEFDGLNTAMSVMLGLVKHDDDRRRAAADYHLAHFFQNADMDFSRYYPDLIRALLLAFNDGDKEVVKAAWTALSALTGRLRKEEMEGLVVSTRQALNQVSVAHHNVPGFSLPKGINAVLPIFLQGLMNGTQEQRTQAALGISDLIVRTSAEELKPFVTQITGPLIRVVSERSVDVKCAILLTLNNLLEKISTFLKPFVPQLQRTFVKSLADPSSELLRSRAAKALGWLIVLTPRIDPLIAELVTGSKTPDAGVRGAMLKALYEVVTKAGKNMNDASKTAILGLIDSDPVDASDSGAAIINARLLGALIKVLPTETATGLMKSRVLTTHFTYASILALNSILAESAETLTESFDDTLPSLLSQGIKHSNPAIAENAVLASGKYLLTPTSNKSAPHIQPLLETLTAVLPAASSTASIDTRRLSLIVLRTAARHNRPDLIEPHLPLLAPSIFSCARDPLIPIKLAAEQAFLAIFDAVDQESVEFDNYMHKDGGELPANTKRSMQDYFKRVALRLAGQARERVEAGGKGVGLAGDEEEDEREVWSVGRVELGDVWSEE
ncbi:ARM repeat-containing protein [Myriangium duriaei CBS 260.36]|uniref:eIF-2-alpha kinase activator GCN1 n=1 Tax=Myriangium duriaei CBS 260.36 TaxID=1168546 RepID=A0A9P4JFS9_9PEZI|nr:ARM repeat-containing protein [Myriangium duriaei CBS 260.36]